MSKTTSDYPNFWERQIQRVLEVKKFELQLSSRGKVDYLVESWPHYQTMMVATSKPVESEAISRIKVASKGTSIMFELGESNE